MHSLKKLCSCWNFYWKLISLNVSLFDYEFLPNAFYFLFFFINNKVLGSLYIYILIFNFTCIALFHIYIKSSIKSNIVKMSYPLHKIPTFTGVCEVMVDNFTSNFYFWNIKQYNYTNKFLIVQFLQFSIANYYLCNTLHPIP